MPNTEGKELTLSGGHAQEAEISLPPTSMGHHGQVPPQDQQRPESPSTPRRRGLRLSMEDWEAKQAARRSTTGSSTHSGQSNPVPHSSSHHSSESRRRRSDHSRGLRKTLDTMRAKEAALGGLGNSTDHSRQSGVSFATPAMDDTGSTNFDDSFARSDYSERSHGSRTGKARRGSSETLDFSEHSRDSRRGKARRISKGSPGATHIIDGIETDLEPALVLGKEKADGGADLAQPGVDLLLRGSPRAAGLAPIRDNSDLIGGTVTPVSYVNTSTRLDLPNLDHDYSRTAPDLESTPLTNDSNSGLAVAQPVQNQSTLQIADLDPIADEDEEKEKRRRQMLRPLAIGLLLLLVVVGVAVGVALATSKSGDAAKEEAPYDPAVSSSYEDQVLRLLPQHAQQVIQHQPDSYQRQAFGWLLQDIYFNGNYSSWRTVQRFAMATFYYATGGGEGAWFDDMAWMSELHECDWTDPASTAEEGFTIWETGEKVYPRPESWCGIKEGSPSDRVMHHFWYSENGAKGEIPLEFFLLTDLKTVKLFNPSLLGGSISSQIGKLRGLEMFTMNNGKLYGSLPTEIGMLTNLKLLLLASNSLDGALPSEIGQLSDLEHLWLEENSLQGNFPSSVGLLTRLSTFYINRNEISGALPTQLGRMTLLSGLSLHHNKLTSSIPSEVGQMVGMQRLAINANELEGRVPRQLGNLPVLRELSIGDNFLEGKLPSQLGLLSNSLELLRLDINLLTGPLPSQLGELSALTSLGLNANYLSGSLPSHIGSLSSLSGLHLYLNDMTGSLPTELAQLTAAKDVALFRNHFTGTIPDVGRLTSLVGLYLSENQLSGTLPTSLGLLTLLEEFRPDVNNFVGPLPSELGRCHALKSLNVSTNALTGEIPEELGYLAAIGSLETFRIDNNLFSGTVPQNLCVLKTYELEFDCTAQLCGCHCVCLVESKNGGL